MGVIIDPGEGEPELEPGLAILDEDEGPGSPRFASATTGDTDTEPHLTGGHGGLGEHLAYGGLYVHVQYLTYKGVRG